MATAAPQTGLPLLYNQIVPLSSQDHATWKMRPMQTLDLISRVHAVPVTVDEFVSAQRHFPIVFSVGPDPVPLALMGLNEGVNVFVGADGRMAPNVYIPAYVRSYPLLLARLNPASEDLSLCFDPTAGLIGDFEDGTPLFENGEPTQAVKDALNFCEQFEMAIQRTSAFSKDLVETDLVEDGEITIQQTAGMPYVYRGFRMVNEQKLRDLRGDQLRKMTQSGMLPLLQAHLFSLSLMTEVFTRQFEQGKVPPQIPAAN